MLTQDQLKANIDAMQTQGASHDQIQGYLDSLRPQPKPNTQGFLNHWFNQTGTLDLLKKRFGGTNFLEKSRQARLAGNKQLSNDIISKEANDLALGFFNPESGAIGGVKNAFPELAAKLEQPGLITKGLQKLAAPFKGALKADVAEEFARENENIVKQAEKTGEIPQRLEVPVSALSKSQTIQQTEALTAKGLFGQQIYDSILSTKEYLVNKANALVEALKPVKQSAEALGNLVKQSLKDYESNFKATQEAIYSKFMKATKNIPAITDETTKTAQVIAQEQSKGLFKVSRPSLDMLIQNLTEGQAQTITKETGLLDEFGKPLRSTTEKPNTLTFENLKATRTQVGQELARTGSKDPILKRLYASLTADMDATVVQKGEHLGEQLKEITSSYKEGINKIKSSLAKSIQSSNPENIVKTLSKRNSVDAFRQLRAVVGEETYQEITEDILGKILESSNTKGTFDVAKFTKNLGRYDKDVMTEIFGKEKVQEINAVRGELERLKTMSDAFKQGDKLREGSQTAYNLFAYLKQSAGGGFMLALLTGQWHTAGAILLGSGAEVATEYATSKLLTSAGGRQYLTTGFAQEVSDAVDAVIAHFPRVRTAARLTATASFKNDKVDVNP